MDVTSTLPRRAAPRRVSRSSLHLVSDDELALAWKHGLPGAQEEAFRRFAPRLVHFAERRLRSRADAADAVQDTFVRASLRIVQLREPAFLRAWLYAITRNRVHDLNTRREVPTEISDETVHGGGGGDEVEDDVVYSAQVMLVRRAASLLNERDRQLVDLHIWQGLPGSEVARRLSIDQAHAYVLVGRARSRLSRMIELVSLVDSNRGRCGELADAAGTEFSRLSVQRVARHLDACSSCLGRLERDRGSEGSLLTAKTG